MRRRKTLSAALAAACALALAACGSSGSAKIELAPSAGATQVPTPTTPKPPPALRTKPAVTLGSGASTANAVEISPSSCSTKQLIKQDLVTGTGQTAQSGQTVTVNYVGVLCSNGKEFDSSWKNGQPVPFPLTAGSVISGWVQGIPGMRVGGRRELIIPSALAYGKGGRPPTIPPNATLVFVVDLLSVS